MRSPDGTSKKARAPPGKRLTQFPDASGFTAGMTTLPPRFLLYTTLSANRWTNGGIPGSYFQIAFGEGVNAFIGFKFDIDGEFHYGWAEMSFTVGDVDNPNVSLDITRAFYNPNAGEAVHIGLIPEPSTLALLSLGAAGVLAQRKRRRES